MAIIQAPQQKSSGFNPLSIIGQVANVATGGALTPILAGAGMVSGLINGDYAGAGLSALAGASSGLFGQGIKTGLNNIFTKGLNTNYDKNVANFNKWNDTFHKAQGLSDYATGTGIKTTQMLDGGNVLGSNNWNKYKSGSWS